VGGCSFLEPGDPGNLQLDWLEVQLELFRERGMQVRGYETDRGDELTGGILGVVIR